MKRPRHVVARTKALASRWKWPLLLGGGALVLFFVNSKTASAATLPQGLPGPSPAPTPSPMPAVVPSGVDYPIQAGTQNIPELPGSGAITSMQVTDANSFWNSLSPGASMSSGYINFPSGSQAAATLFPTRYDSYGSPYVQWAGAAYILIGPDSSGNYTATQVMV